MTNDSLAPDLVSLFWLPKVQHDPVLTDMAKAAMSAFKDSPSAAMCTEWGDQQPLSGSECWMEIDLAVER